MKEKIIFPIIKFDRFSFEIIPCLDILTKTTSAGLRNRLFENIVIVDSNGFTYFVKNATKVKGLGRFFGYNIFLNQTILVDLNFEPNIEKIQLNDLKKKMVKNVHKEKAFWASGGNFDKIIELINHSESINALISDLGEVVNKVYHA
ncbi:hypothetical protein FEM33_19035 [Dyadobacter flavalbus]|uniref:Uncharacterized protein n=1 Tax=Dyadobacter flavalbus TaxID=2579942 RepID=A0A5M8QRT2_9BACT|nr:hypothetical protein [Dyadobacter flavalbus]KAA6437968.1 hypothetical protein FEM33_19035 [Dyadobacter flavalbus]